MIERVKILVRHVRHDRNARHDRHARHVPHVRHVPHDRHVTHDRHVELHAARHARCHDRHN